MKIYGIVLNALLSIALICTSMPAIATEDNGGMIEGKITKQDIQKLENMLDSREAEMEISTFEKKLDKKLISLEKKMNRKIFRMSEKKAEKKYQSTKNMIMKGHHEALKNEVAQMDASNMTTKEKLIALNSNPENRALLKEQIMNQVKFAGGVKKFLKNLKQKIQDKRQADSNVDDWMYEILSVVALIIIAIVFGPQAALAIFIYYAIETLVSFVVIVAIVIIIILVMEAQNVHSPSTPEMTELDFQLH